MYTVVYMAEDGNLKEQTFSNIQSAREFCVQISKLDIPVRKIEDMSRKPKTRIEELDELINLNRKELNGLNDKLKNAIDKIIRYSIERHEIMKKV